MSKNILDDLDVILAKHNGELGLTWEDPTKVTPDTKQEILRWVADEIIGEEIDYEKYGKCPSCTASMMYQCTCDSGSLYTVIQQKKRLAQYGYKGGEV